MSSRLPVKGRTGLPAPAEPASFAAVARKLSRWTTNLLATALVLVLALGVGRQLVGWWRFEPGAAAAGGGPEEDSSLGANEAWLPNTLAFGDSPYVIERREGHGDRAAAIEQLLAACREVASQAAVPLVAPGETESQLLAATAALEPLATSGTTRYYGLGVGIPLVVGIAPAAGEPPDVSPPHQAPQPQQPAESLARTSPPVAAEPAPAMLGASRNRVVVWGLAAAAGAQDWSLYIFRQSARSASAQAQTPDVPLPPDCQRTLALGDARGETLLGLAGGGSRAGALGAGDHDTGNPVAEPAAAPGAPLPDDDLADSARADRWRSWFAREWPRQGWTVTEDWRTVGDVWHARYRHVDGSSRWTAELQFGPQSGGGLAGLVRIVPQ